MIVKSILDTDLYKFTTSYAYMKLFPHAIGTFEFFDRDNTEYTEEFVQQLWIEISNFCSLKLTHDEQDYMTTHCRFIPPMYWEWLSGIRLSAGKVQIWLDEDKHLHIKATDYLYRVTLYEVPILAIVSELRNRMLNHTINMTDVLIRLEPKIVLSNQNQMFFSEFGTRRRYSYNVQEAIEWIPVDSIDKYQWAFGHDEIIKEFTEWMHLEDGDLDMQDIDLDPV